MNKLVDIAWTLAAIAMLATYVWGVGWCLDEEERQVRTGKKLPGTTNLPIADHELTTPAHTPISQNR